MKHNRSRDALKNCYQAAYFEKHLLLPWAANPLVMWYYVHIDMQRRKEDDQSTSVRCKVRKNTVSWTAFQLNRKNLKRQQLNKRNKHTMGGMETVALLRRFTKQTQSLHDMSETTKAAAKLGICVSVPAPAFWQHITSALFTFPTETGFQTWRSKCKRSHRGNLCPQVHSVAQGQYYILASGDMKRIKKKPTHQTYFSWFPELLTMHVFI